MNERRRHRDPSSIEPLEGRRLLAGDVLVTLTPPVAPDPAPTLTLEGDSQSNHVVIQKVDEVCVVAGLDGTTLTYLGATSNVFTIPLGTDEVNIDASLGSGDDTLLITGAGFRAVNIETASGNDVVRALEMSQITGDIIIDTGAGHDRVRVSDVSLFPGNNLEVNTGGGSDIIWIGHFSLTAGNLHIDLGSGVDGLIFDDTVIVGPGAAFINGGPGFDVAVGQAFLLIFPPPDASPFDNFEVIV